MPRKIINWTFGSFFRTIGRIIAYTLIGCGVGFLLNKLNLFNIMVVNASTMPYTSAYLNVNQCESYCNVQGTNCYIDLDTCIWDTNNTTGNSIQFGLNNGYLNKIEFNIKDSGDYQPGNYNLIINWGIDPRNINEFNKYTIRVFGSRNNSNDVEIPSNCTITNGTGNYDFNTSCNFSTLDKYDHFKILYTYVGANCTFDSNDNTYYCNDLTLIPQLTRAMSFNRINSFDFDDNPTNAINNQTTIISNDINNVNNSINDLTDLINDNSSPDVSSFSNLVGYLPPGPVDSILTLPLSLLNSLNQALSSSSCQALHLPIPFIGGFIDIPCLNTIFSQIEGLTLFWESIGLTLGGLILYSYFCDLYDWVDDITSLKHKRARLFGAKSEAKSWEGAV